MKNIGKIVAIIVISVLVLIALLTGANILFFWSIFGFIEKAVIAATGLDSNLARALAALAVSLLFVFPIGKMILSFSPLPQKKKQLYRSLVFVAVSAFFILAYFGQRDVYFDPSKGDALKYYSETNGKYKIYDRPGFDPITGDSLLPVTRDVVLKSKGLYIEVVEPPDERPGISGYNNPVLESRQSEPQAMESPPEVNDDADDNSDRNATTMRKKSVSSPRREVEADNYDEDGVMTRRSMSSSRREIEAGNSIMCVISNHYRGRLLVTNLSTRRVFTVPALVVDTVYLVPGAYSAAHADEVINFTVRSETIDYVFGDFNPVEKVMNFEVRGNDRFNQSEDSPGTLICENASLKRVTVYKEHNIVKVLTVLPSETKAIVLPPGKYIIVGSFGDIYKNEIVEILPNKLLEYRYDRSILKKPATPYGIIN